MNVMYIYMKPIKPIPGKASIYQRVCEYVDSVINTVQYKY